MGVIFPAMGISVISVDENCEIDSSDYYGDDYLLLKNLFNDMYAKDISKKVRSSLVVRKYNGEFNIKKWKLYRNIISR